jgi:hypothetical protein
MQSPEDDRSHRYNNQKHRTHDYDNYSLHSQVAVGYRDNNNQGDKHQNNGYRNDNIDDSGPNRQFRPRNSRDYNQSPDDILNGPCHMHYTYVDGKRVLNHMLKDCRTFIKLEEAAGSKQAEARNQGYAGILGRQQTMHHRLLRYQPTEPRWSKDNKTSVIRMMEDTSHQKATSRQ